MKHVQAIKNKKQEIRHENKCMKNWSNKKKIAEIVPYTTIEKQGRKQINRQEVIITNDGKDKKEIRKWKLELESKK